METRLSTVCLRLRLRWDVGRISAALGLVLTGCATEKAPPPAPIPTAPAGVSAPQAKPLQASTAAHLNTLFPTGQSRPLFNGQSLQGWKITDFAGGGNVSVEKNVQGSAAIVLEEGAVLTGITWTNAVPTIDYEIELDALKLLGSDFFCGLTFPFEDSFCTFICGGWGGAVVGISSVDGQDASLNETTKYLKFDQDRWYHIKVRVTKGRIETWIDDEKMADLETAGKKIAMRLGEIEESAPLGIAAYQTRAALRNITLRRLPSAP